MNLNPQRHTMLRDIVTLIFGTAGGRIILLLAMPFVTRMYEPEDFKLLAVFAALVSTATSIACFRIEIAIPFANNDEDAANLLALAIIAATCFASILALPAWLVPTHIATWIGTPDLRPYLWLVPLAVLMASMYNSLQSWSTRKRRFGAIARTRVSQSVIGTGITILFGLIGLSPIGLLLGNALNSCAGALPLAYHAWTSDRSDLRTVKLERIRSVITRYKHYPIFSSPEALANVAAIQFPILIIAAAEGRQAGQLFLATQVMMVPMTLIGAAIGQVYASRATDELNKGTLRNFTTSMMWRLFYVGVGPITIAAILAPDLFSLVFGENWRQSGAIVAWIAPWMLLQLLVSPVSMALHVTNSQRTAMTLQLSGAALRIGSVSIAATIIPDRAVEVYALSGIAFYAAYLLVILHTIRVRGEQANR